jgi:hypothetical protein
MNISVELLERLIAPIVWSEPKPPCEECRYDHIRGKSALGDFLITWKSWKQYDSPTIDETPWGEWLAACDNVDDAKAKAEAAYKEKILSTFNLEKLKLVPSSNWSITPPTEVGDYFVSCDENRQVPFLVEVILRNGFLAVDDRDVGVYPIDIYHDNLSLPMWSKAILSN